MKLTLYIAAAGVSRKLHGLLASLRAGEWWEHKLIPIITMSYLTCSLLEAPLISLWPSLLMLLLALVPGAAYVSVLNDWTDRTEDLAAGKPNRLAGRSRSTMRLLIGIPLLSGLLFAILWRRDPLLLMLYLGAWLAFTLYSLAPVRLKTRGFPGALADAAGAHLFPTLLAAVLVFRALGRPVDWLWLGAAATWALAYGLRGILWHQLKDLDNDRLAGVRTFAQRHPVRTVLRLAAFGIFPLELIGLLLLLWQVGSLLPVILLALYAVSVVGRVRWRGMQATIIGAPARFLIVMQEYYDAFLPAAVLLGCALLHGEDLIILGLHVLLFPRCISLALVELVRLLYRAHGEVRRLLQRLRLHMPHRR